MSTCLQQAWIVTHQMPTQHPMYEAFMVAQARLPLALHYMDSERHAPVPGMQIGSITTTGHSLGGALAALCAADIADCLNGMPGNSTPAEEAVALPNELERLISPPATALAGLAANTQQRVTSAVLSNKAEELYDRTQAAVDGFRAAMGDHLKLPGRPMPPVTAVTFGAPRVGDRNFAAKFGTCRCHACPRNLSDKGSYSASVWLSAWWTLSCWACK